MSKKKEPITITHAHLLDEWDYSKNPNGPENYSQGSKYKAWWKCSLGHSWNSIIPSRAKGAGCPYCSGNKILVGFNDLATTHPQLLSEWDYNKNNVLPNSISGGSNKKFWWKCSDGHSYSCRTHHRTGSNAGCPYCTNQRVLVGYNDFESRCPELMKFWDWEKNENLPCEFVFRSRKKVHWKCDIDGYEWVSSPGALLGGRGCSVCSGNVVMAGVNDLCTTHPEVARDWDYEKNEILPTEISNGSDRKVWWICDSGHSYYKRVAARKNGGGCPICAGKKVLVGYNDLASRCPELLDEWDYEKNVLGPESYTFGSHKRAWWKCSLAHSWFAIIKNRSLMGLGCPYCSGNKVLAGVNDLSATHPDIAAQWAARNSFGPCEVSAGSDKKVFWNCENDHEWRAAVNDRKRGNGCPQCSQSGGEKELGIFIESIFQGTILYGNREVIAPSELDIYVPELKVAVEFNGIYWHSDAVLLGRTGKLAREYHQLKLDRCRELGIDLLFVWEDDWKNRHDEVKIALKEYFESRTPNSMFKRLE